jgi:hypothetical protein
MISTLDLSSVTDRVVDYLTSAVTTWPGWTTNGGTVTPFNLDVSGRMPETVRNLGGCHLTMYLFHVTADASTRNTPLTGKSALPNKSHAIGLTLYYLLTAYARDNATQEQQAMSIGVKALHERGTYVDPADGFTFTITLDPEKADEANRRWQSYSTAFRLSAVYRVSVVFLSPTVIPGAPAPAPQRIGLSLAPLALPFAGAGALTSTASRVDCAPLSPVPGDTIVYDYSPAIVAAGGSFAVFGAGLGQPTASRLFLLDAVGTETEVTAWKAPAAQNTASRVVVRLPATVGAVPANSPTPGVYQLRVGSSIALGDPATYRSNAVPVLVSAFINPPASPWNPVGGTFSFTGLGFVAAAAELLIDTVTLSKVAGAPGAGEFQVSGSTINFRPPAGMTPGPYFVRLRVHGVEGPPVGRIVI